MTTWATIKLDLDALRHNFKHVRACAPHSKVLAMVKANAYGHGLLACAQVFNEADALGVARLCEAKALRAGGITQPIVLMAGVLNVEELAMAADLSLDLCVHQFEQLSLLTNHMTPLRLWLKVDTGMGRLGFQPEEMPAVFSRVARLPCVKKWVLFSHFSDADDSSQRKSREQLACFLRLSPPSTYEKSLANSAAILDFPESHSDWVRPGIMLYGASPWADRAARSMGLKPAMTLTARLIAIKTLPAGATIGYGSRYQCRQAMRVGVVGIGYGDGYPRVLAADTPVYLCGRYTVILGQVSMDMLTIDLSDIAATLGDAVELWGAHVPVDEVAAKAGTTAYALLTHMCPRACQQSD